MAHLPSPGLAMQETGQEQTQPRLKIGTKHCWAVATSAQYRADTKVTPGVRGLGVGVGPEG